MNETPVHIVQSQDQFVQLADGTQYEEWLRDEHKMRRRLFDAMKASDDPMTREVGNGLADGSLTFRALATSSAYSDFLAANLAALRELDVAGMTEQLVQERDVADAQRREKTLQQEHDDEEDVWQGFDDDQS